ncbi:hypothetical protein Slin15195_G130240 [Septoria linicola]|uniref:Uncharacterized protein n=1 Tax=Septoria linicola TaxID=215465 RepID=A0A9Q9B311_9PEZI|nr:hypothetical protein Slin14017_G122120 [Septoria linicola]USW59705.1 hypothetical protein Slin15195_G130240 [Septoria linicola]
MAENQQATEPPMMLYLPSSQLYQTRPCEASIPRLTDVHIQRIFGTSSVETASEAATDWRIGRVPVSSVELVYHRMYGTIVDPKSIAMPNSHQSGTVTTTTENIFSMSAGNLAHYATLGDDKMVAPRYNERHARHPSRQIQITNTK